MAAPSAGDEPVVLGRIVGAHGIRGEVVLMSFTAEPQAIARYGPLDMLGGGGSLVIEALRPAKAGFIARLAGITDRNAAEALKGTELAVPRHRLPAAGADEVYHADLIGLAVRLKDGQTIGRVTSVENYGAGDLLAVRLDEGGREVLLPFNREAVPTIDVAAGFLVVDPPEGLLEP